MSPNVPLAASGSGAAAAGSSTSAASTPAPITEDMFLQLLVAQLENQDPTNPADSTQFVTQLAQFQTMEQSLSQGQDISAMRQDADQIVTLLTANNGTTGSAASGS